jgi:hypothetical protein
MNRLLRPWIRPSFQASSGLEPCKTCQFLLFTHFLPYHFWVTFTHFWYGKFWVILWAYPCLKVNTYLAFVLSADHLI